ncbi:MAG TPA: hypothetical protein VMT19_02780 [Thermoanaerobaculaceae bacterium]|nr:hypothetical protein [Thermoanaerobaculaceae bacterium]
MESTRLTRNIEAVRQLLAAAIGGAVVEYVEPRGEMRRWGRHLFQCGQPPLEHRLWLDEQVLEGFDNHRLLAWLKGNDVVKLFATTNDRDVLCATTWSKPELIDRIELSETGGTGL